MHEVVNLYGKKIIVTGASSGIGRATAILLSKMGCEVYLVARNEERLQETLNEMEGIRHESYVFDLNDLDGIENLISKIIKAHGAVDGLVHCAGIHGTRPLKLMKPKDVMDVMSINTLAFIELSRCVSKRNCFCDGMSIVGISSISSKIGNKGKVAYCASKGAMDAAMRAMAKELAPKKIRVNTVLPGVVKTALFDEVMNGASGEAPEFQRVLESQHLGIMGAEDVANVVSFLLSSSSSYITGTALPIWGGA